MSDLDDPFFGDELDLVMVEGRLLAIGAVLDKPTPVQVCEFNEGFSRTPFKAAHMQLLKESKVLLAGAGSVGSPIATSLTRAGVSGLRLADPERFAIENMFRHECDKSHVGRYKVDALREKCLRINPALRIQSISEDIFSWSESEFDSLLEDVSIMVMTTDRNKVQLAGAVEAFYHKKPSVFAGCFEEARPWRRGLLATPWK